MNIAERHVRDLILRARAYDGKEEIEDFQPDPDSGETDAAESLQTGQSDPTRAEIERWFSARDEEALAELLALYWIGRGDFEGREFRRAVRDASQHPAERTPAYLLGAPMLGDFLEMGLDAVIDADVYDDA